MIKTGRKVPSCALQTHRRAQTEAALKTQQRFSNNKSLRVSAPVSPDPSASITLRLRLWRAASLQTSR